MTGLEIETATETVIKRGTVIVVGTGTGTETVAVNIGQTQRHRRRFRRRQTVTEEGIETETVDKRQGELSDVATTWKKRLSTRWKCVSSKRASSSILESESSTETTAVHRLSL